MLIKKTLRQIKLESMKFIADFLTNYKNGKSIG